MSIVALASLLCSVVPATSPWESEVIYQIFPRSFCDSNGDRVGDLKGITSKLDYLKGLGITALLINPIQASPMYHSYFADDFLAVDPSYGTKADFFNLVHEAHRRHLKVILDMEVQYVSERHPWAVAAKADPNSVFAKYLWDNKGFLTSGPLPLYTGAKTRATSIDPDNPAVLTYMKSVFLDWAAPSGDPAKGVDGFRLDHIMDDLDWQKVKTGMLTNFWRPIVREVRAVKPAAFFVGEQSDWNSLGTDLFAKAEVDAAYAIPQYRGLLTSVAAKARRAVEMTVAATPAGKTQLNFIENHDVTRFASVVKGNPDLLRLGALLNLTLKGTPMIYYGQELGMRGGQGQWGSDGNDIPLRLAYRWGKKLSDKGTATWYAGTGPWAEIAYSTDDDGISVREQSGKDSLLSFYRKLIRLRFGNEALREGSQSFLDLEKEGVFGFLRSGKRRVAVLANFTDQPKSVVAIQSGVKAKDLWSGAKVDSDVITIAPRGFRVIEYR